MVNNKWQPFIENIKHIFQIINFHINIKLQRFIGNLEYIFKNNKLTYKIHYNILVAI